jgi:hypothetical protein
MPSDVERGCNLLLGVVEASDINWKANSEAFSSSSLLASLGTTNSALFGGGRQNLGH